MKTTEELRETLREEKQLKVAHQILGDYAQASINDANIKQLIKELTPVAEPVTLSIQTKEFAEKLRREIEELGDDIDEIVRMLYSYKYDFEEQIEDAEKHSKILVDMYERGLEDAHTIIENMLDENDEDDYAIIDKLGDEILFKVDNMRVNEQERLYELYDDEYSNLDIIEELLSDYQGQL